MIISFAKFVGQKKKIGTAINWKKTLVLENDEYGMIIIFFYLLRILVKF
jgi:hypothetical protein